MDVFFDYSSPWTYLAFIRLQQLVAEYRERGIDLKVTYKPVLVGVVFNKVNPSVYDMRKNPVLAKARYMNADMKEWCEAFGLSIRLPYGPNPPEVFPVNSAKVLRGAFFAMEHGQFIEYSVRVFGEYWLHGRDISSTPVLEQIAAGLGYSTAEFLKYAASDETAKAKLQANTQELMDRGGFGSPTVFFDGMMFFGNDRLSLLQRRIDLHFNPKLVGGGHSWTWKSVSKL